MNTINSPEEGNRMNTISRPVVVVAVETRPESEPPPGKWAGDWAAYARAWPEDSIEVSIEQCRYRTATHGAKLPANMAKLLFPHISLRYRE